MSLGKGLRAKNPRTIFVVTTGKSENAPCVLPIQMDYERIVDEMAHWKATLEGDPPGQSAGQVHFFLNYIHFNFMLNLKY